MDTLSDLMRFGSELPPSERMPVVFVGHGSPMNAIEENVFTKGFRAMAASIPRPKAIVCISAHWYTRGTKVTMNENQRTIYDFGGFPPALSAVKYPAKGDAALANETIGLLGKDAAVGSLDWGLDHGAWSVLKHFYPEADIPVVQLSIDYTKPPVHHIELAKRLSSLRSKGVLVMGSGNLVHNLGKVDFANMDRPDYGYDWALEARDKFNGIIQRGDGLALTDYGNMGTAVSLAVPTPEHFLPAIYIMGLKKENELIRLYNDRMVAGSLSMTSFVVGQ